MGSAKTPGMKSISLRLSNKQASASPLMALMFLVCVTLYVPIKARSG